ncbi:DUF4328 domain-containing protein [Caulobacter sp. LjRoot300]|uniref:DUF4328 domain-containing protein n=1 Tax=Caulobacter sp. LjRoot300 TaxID=3342321 RepID=UPI003ED0341B
MAKKKVYTSKSPTRRAKGAIVGLWMHLAGAAAYGAATAWQLSFLLQLDPGTTLSADDLGSQSTGFILSFALSAMVYAASLPIYLVLFLMWVHRTNRNAHVLAPSFDMSPAWGVGWFFVPVACLTKPFEGVEKTWNISTDSARWRSLDTPNLLRVWWGLFLATNVVALVGSFASSDNTAGGQSLGACLTIATMLAAIGSSITSIMLVRQLTQRQVTALSMATFE